MINRAMNIDAKGSKPDQPVHLMRIVETITPTLPRVSCSVSFDNDRRKGTHRQNMQENASHVVRMGVIVTMGVVVGVGVMCRMRMTMRVSFPMIMTVVAVLMTVTLLLMAIMCIGVRV